MNMTHRKLRDMILVSLFAVLIAVGAWISIPGPVPFTLQTLGVFCAAGILGGKRGTLSVLVYLLLGAVGVPVFAGFTGGLGVLLGMTGGYIVGFQLSVLAYWLATGLLGNRMWAKAAGMLLGLVVCYAFGTAWFMAVYRRSAGGIGLTAALLKCVVPFIVPDLGKIGLALFLSKLLHGRIRELDA